MNKTKKNIFKTTNEIYLDSILKKFSDKIVFIFFINDFSKNKKLISDCKNILAHNFKDCIFVLVDITNFLNNDEKYIGKEVNIEYLPSVIIYYDFEILQMLKNIDVEKSYPLIFNIVKLIRIKISQKPIKEETNEDEKELCEYAKQKNSQSEKTINEATVCKIVDGNVVCETTKANYNEMLKELDEERLKKPNEFDIKGEEVPNELWNNNLIVSNVSNDKMTK